MSIKDRIAEIQLINDLLTADIRLLRERLYNQKIIEDPKGENYD